MTCWKPFVGLYYVFPMVVRRLAGSLSLCNSKTNNIINYKHYYHNENCVSLLRSLEVDDVNMCQGLSVR